MNRCVRFLSLIVFFLVTLSLIAFGQVQFKIPIYITCSATSMAGKVDSMFFGVSGDGPNPPGTIIDNTYGPDINGFIFGEFTESQPPGGIPPRIGTPGIGEILESQVQSQSLLKTEGNNSISSTQAYWFLSTWQQIPGRYDPPPGGISASGLKPSDFRGWTSFSQIDTFLLNVKIGPAPAASGAITFTIPPNLRLFASRYEMLKSDADGIYQPFDPDISYPVGRTTVVDSNKAKSKDLWYLIIKYGAYSPETSTSVLISNGWNLVSVPRTQIDYTADNIFPSKFGSMFGYCSPSYCEEPILELGKGYWLFSNQTSNTFVGGTPTDSITINAYYGWNLIGSRETIVNISSLSLNNGAAIFGDAFRFDCVSGSYQPTPVINPGEAVWIYVTADCVITIP